MAAVSKGACAAALGAVALAFFAGCERGHETPPTPNESHQVIEPLEQPLANSPLVEKGGAIFHQHCQRCHGEGAVGAPDWRKMDAEGMYPPPPLNGSGHAWHHPHRVLREFILKGSQPGQGRMPAWQGKLSDDDVDAVIAWFQSMWPAQAYEAWSRVERRDRSQSR